MNWLTIIPTAVLTGLVAFGLHSIDIWRLDAAQAAALAAQRVELTHQVETANKITQGVSNDYENRLADLNHQLDSLRGRTACVPIAAPSGGHYAAAGQPKPVSEGAIYDLAGEGEKYRIQLAACQAFVTTTWGQNAKPK